MRRILQPCKDLVLSKQYFSNKNVLITGGGSGLGKQMALDYSRLGANVMIVGRNEKKLANASSEIFSETQNKPRYSSLDVRNKDDVTNLAANMEMRYGVPDIVINNAAGNFINKSELISENGWSSIIDIVLKGTVNITTEFGKRLINNSKPGVFINISTTYAQTGSSFVVPSAVAKAGCNNLTRSLASEWGKYGIRLLSVAPGPIYTEGAFNRLDPTNEFTKIAEKRLPLGRLGDKQEFSNFITFLTSNYCNWMTGEIINFDGGEVVGNAGEFNFLNHIEPEQLDNMFDVGKLNNTQKQISYGEFLRNNPGASRKDRQDAIKNFYQSKL